MGYGLSDLGISLLYVGLSSVFVYFSDMLRMLTCRPVQICLVYTPLFCVRGLSLSCLYRFFAAISQLSVFSLMRASLD